MPGDTSSFFRPTLRPKIRVTGPPISVFAMSAPDTFLGAWRPSAGCMVMSCRFRISDQPWPQGRADD